MSNASNAIFVSRCDHLVELLAAEFVIQRGQRGNAMGYTYKQDFECILIYFYVFLYVFVCTPSRCRVVAVDQPRGEKEPCWAGQINNTVLVTAISSTFLNVCSTLFPETPQRQYSKDTGAVVLIINTQHRRF